MAESSSSEVIHRVNTQKQNNGETRLENAEKDKTDKVVTGPILLDEFKYNEEPRSLRNLLKFFDGGGPTATRTDVLVGLVYILAIESGFVPKNHDAEDCSFDYKRLQMLTCDFSIISKQENVHSFTLILPNFPLYECKFACVTVADDLILNCVVKGVQEAFTLVLDPLTYFTSSNTNVKLCKLQNLDHLSRNVKNDICFRCKSAIFSRNDVIFPCLEHLPPEVLLIVLRKFRVVDLVRFSKTNRYFHGLVKEFMGHFLKKEKVL